MTELITELTVDPSRYDAFIFDFDGTLVDSLQIWHQLDIDYLALYGLTCPPNLSHEISGKSFTETARYFQDRFGITKSVEDIKEDWIRMTHDLYLTEVSFRPGAQSFLKRLHDAGAPLGLATSNTAAITEDYFHHANIHYIDAFSYTCDVARDKPSPDVFLAAAKKLGANPARCLAFEDTREGVTAAAAAGMEVIAVAEEMSLPYRSEILKRAGFMIPDYTGVQLAC